MQRQEKDGKRNAEGTKRNERERKIKRKRKKKETVYEVKKIKREIK
jgi:hypothetical protein